MNTPSGPKRSTLLAVLLALALFAPASLLAQDGFNKGGRAHKGAPSPDAPAAPR